MPNAPRSISVPPDARQYASCFTNTIQAQFGQHEGLAAKRLQSIGYALFNLALLGHKRKKMCLPTERRPHRTVVDACTIDMASRYQYRFLPEGQVRLLRLHADGPHLTCDINHYRMPDSMALKSNASLAAGDVAVTPVYNALSHHWDPKPENEESMSRSALGW